MAPGWRHDRGDTVLLTAKTASLFRYGTRYLMQSSSRGTPRLHEPHVCRKSYEISRHRPMFGGRRRRYIFSVLIQDKNPHKDRYNTRSPGSMTRQ